LEVPKDADIVIEGYVDSEEDLMMEGPFGDHTGFYSLADLYPRFHVTCITHRKDAIYPATIVGIPPQEDLYLGKATERLFLTPIRMAMLPEIVDMHMPAEGVFHNIAIVSIRKEYEGHAVKVMNALWGAGQMMFNKFMVVVPEGIDIHNDQEVLKCIAKNVEPLRDLYFSKGPADVLDHSSRMFALSGKLGIDATCDTKEIVSFKIPDASALATIDGAISHVDLRPALAGLPAILIHLKKSAKGQIKQLHESLCNGTLLNGIKFIFYLDAESAAMELKDLVWMIANHIDPSHDCFLVPIGDEQHCAGFDASIKTLEHDGFTRDWPNPVVMDESTIAYIDANWDRIMGIPFIPSPSLPYIKLNGATGAIARKNSK
jgi:4-hydroxy-3-polyprenylbenzoate decarboxylase